MQLVRFWLIMHEHWKTEWRCLTFLWMSLTFASLPTFWQDYVALSTKADAGHPSQWQELLGWSSLAKSSVASRSFWGDNFIDKAFTVMSFGVREALGIGLPKMRVFFLQGHLLFQKYEVRIFWGVFNMISPYKQHQMTTTMAPMAPMAFGF